MSSFSTKVPLQKKGKGKCQKLASAKEDINYVWNNSKYNESKDILNEIYTADTLEGQISSLKDISKKIASEPCYEKRLLATDFLLELYFTLPINSLLRTPLIRILSSMPDCINMMMESIITERFIGKINTKTCELNEIIDLSTVLFGFLENSMFKYFWAENLKSLILNFLESSLIECHRLLLEEVPPTKKLIIINCIHNCVRCTITLLQKCSPNPSEKFYFIAKKLVIEEQLPSDTRSNCGMLYILLYKCLYQDISSDELIYDLEELSCISQLCITSGLLNALKSDELKIILKWKNSDIPLLQILFKKILEIEESNPTDSCLILGVSRCVHLVSKSLLNLPELLTENLLNNFLIYLWIHLEHYIDAVRHIASSILSNIILIGKCNGKRFVFDTIVEETSKMQDEKKAKHVGIIALVGHVPINSLLQKSPGLIKKLLSIAENSSSVDQVVMTFESLMKQHFKETSDINEWFKLWIDPLLVAMGNKLNDALEHIVTNAIKLNTKMIHYVISLQSLNEDQNLKNIGIVLVCLRTSRKYGLLKFNEKNENWKGLLSYSLLRRCISHSDVEIRMSSFSLLVECQKTTEQFIIDEFDLFKLIFLCNINNQCPATRQKTLALIKKFLSRFKDSYQSLMRSSNKIKQLSDIEKESIENKVNLNSYDEFKIWLINFGIENIFPGANFSRRGTSLNILLLCHEFGFWNSDVFTENNAEVLLKCLLDPYEENKIIAKNLLSVMPLEKILFKDNHYVNLYLKSTVEMALSIRPPDSTSAAYFIGLLISFPQLTNAVVEASGIQVNSVDNPFLLTFILLSIILNQLEKELAIANKSILKAASSAPMYGQIFVIRHILQGLQYRPLNDNLEWKYIINRIINIAFKCDEVVACVVNNSSPEGHLPMDFNCGNFFAEEINTDETSVTAQMVLLCSWRTVKEVSLLLGEIVEQLSSYKDTILITKDQIVRIGNHLMKLLLETKHRGAFEQAYLGFCKLAGSLWKCSIGNLHELPFQWLTDTLNAISTNENLSATRRSAGIPFIIQGLVFSELQVGSSKCLTIALNILFGLLNSAEASTEARVHALNILRALFRHHMLGEMVGPYVAQGLAIAINGFNSDNWAERNSSTLLLAALMVRIFGVPRSREKISWKNKLTGRIFFQRYPTLYGELLEHLKLASVDSLYPATYPVLLILGRLYPSPLEGTDSNLQLNTFIPFVSKCASSSIFKTRTLAASAMVALISPHMYVGFINALFQDISSSQNENRTHGLLLQVIQLLRHSANLPEEYLIQRNLNMNKWFSEVTTLLYNKKHSYIVKECCLKIVINCLPTCYQHISLQNLQDIIKIVEIELFEHNEEFGGRDFIGLNGFLVHAAIVLLLISYLQKSVLDFSYKINLCLTHEMYEVVATALDFISFILNNESCYDPDLNDVDPIGGEIVDCNNQFKHYFMNDVFLSKIFINKLNHTYHHEDCVKLLNSGKNLQVIFELLAEENVSIINFFTAICEQSPAILGSYVIQWISSYVSYKENALSLKGDELDHLCGLLKHLSNPESNYECRLAVSNFIKNNFHTLIKCSSEVNYLTIWTCFLNLLNDDDAEVRVLMSSIFSSEIVNSEVLQISLDNYLKDTSVNNLVKAVGLISWAIGNFNSDEDKEYNDRVFEKGDSNTYNEELLICKIAINCLKKLYETDSSIHTTILPNNLAKWITEVCSFNIEFSTLQDIFHCFKKEANRFFSKSNGITPYRAMEMKKLILEQKINFMQEFMQF